MEAEDILFLLRHDETRLARIMAFLSWKGMRRLVRSADSDDLDDDGT